MQEIQPKKIDPTQNPDTKQIISLLKENKKYLQAIYESTEKARKYILWGRIMTLVYIVVIVAPLIVALIYLPPYFGQIFEPYKELLQVKESSGGNANQYLNILKNLNF